MRSLVLHFIRLELDIAKKYHVKILFNLIHISCIVLLFHYISETFGVIEILKGPYFPYVATGLAFSYLSSGIVSASSNKIVEWRDLGVLEAVLLSPKKPWKIYLSAGFFEIFTATLKFTLITLLISIFFIETNLNPQKILCFFAAVAFTFAIGLCLSLVETSTLLLWKRFSLISGFSTISSLFLSGIYFPVTVLPKFLQIIALINPFFHALQLIRFALQIKTPDQELVSISTSFFTLIMMTVAAFSLAIFLYSKSEQHLFKNGGHSHL